MQHFFAASGVSLMTSFILQTTDRDNSELMNIGTQMTTLFDALFDIFSC